MITIQEIPIEQIDDFWSIHINSEKEDSVRFWKSLGFEDNGKDEWGMNLLIKK